MSSLFILLKNSETYWIAVSYFPPTDVLKKKCVFNTTIINVMYSTYLHNKI